MPMLERTAASLEPCNLQRVLPPAKTPFKSRRRLHTAFWQHGAADIDLSSVWQTFAREPLESVNLFPDSQPQSESQPQSQAQSPRTEPLTASSFLLDFLYPQGATSLLRKLSPSALDKFERPRLYLRGATPRLFTSSASLSKRSRPTAQETTAEDPAQASAAQDEVITPEENLAERDDKHIKHDLDQDSENELDEDLQIQLDEDLSKQYDDSGQDLGIKERLPVACATKHSRRELIARRRDSALRDSALRDSALKELRVLVQKDREDDFDRIWRAFHATSLSLQDRDDNRPQFLDYVTKHRNLSQLLVRTFELKEWETLWAVWGRYPEAHGDDTRALNFRQFKRVFSAETLFLAMESIATRIRHAEKVPKVAKHTDPELSNTLLKNVIRPLIRQYIPQSDPKHYIPLLNIMKDPLLYEDFLMFTTNAKQTETAHELYTLYRKLPGVKIRGHVMRNMIEHVYCRDNLAGMELVMKDFYTRFGRLDIRSYRKYMNFYSRQGDLHAVKRLWDEYIMHYAVERKREIDGYGPNTMKENSNPDFVPLLHIYASQGEIESAREVFSTAQDEWGPKLNALCWNILLNAHAQAGEYDGAVRVFGVMVQAINPDKYSFGTIMGLSGSRGDLEFTLELYRMSKNRGIAPTVTIVDCVVEAYCQNDKFSDAESIVKMTTEKGTFPKEQLVTLWNTLLDHHANRRDLTAMNQLLNEMTEDGIQYDSETYSILMRGLALCRQPHHALYLLQQAVKGRSFKPTIEHYSLLMSAFIQSGQPQELLRTSTILRSLGMPQTASILYRVLQGLRSWALSPPDTDPAKSRIYLVSALRQFRQSIERAQKPRKIILQRRAHDEPWIEWNPDPDTVKSRTQQASLLIFTFSQLRSFAEVPEILKLWKSSSPQASRMSEPPVRLLQALMLAAFHEDKYNEVHEIWKLVFDRAVQVSRVAAPGATLREPLPAMRYMLNVPLKTMQDMYAVTGDADGLRETVASVLRAGFRLDSKNWNYYVQLLAGMKKWREAFVVCEEQLMPFWRGWRGIRNNQADVPSDLPLNVRRRGTDPHMPRPISYTLTVLSKAYMDLENMSAWSTDAEHLKNYIAQKAPSAVAAVQIQVRSRNTYEQDIMMGSTKPGANARLEKKRARNKSKVPMGPLVGEHDDGIPAAFHELMMSAEAQTQGREVGMEQDDWEGGGAAAATPPPAAGFQEMMMTEAHTRAGRYRKVGWEQDDWEDVSATPAATPPAAPPPPATPPPPPATAPPATPPPATTPPAAPPPAAAEDARENSAAAGFQEMIMTAEAQARAGRHRKVGWEQDEWEDESATPAAPPPPAAEDAHESPTGAHQEDDEWSDVEEYDDDIRTLKGPDGPHARGREGKKGSEEKGSGKKGSEKKGSEKKGSEEKKGSGKKGSGKK